MMRTINFRMTATLILTLLLSAVALAQTPAAPTPAPEAKEPEYVQEKGFKTKIFEIKNRDPFEIQSAIRPLQSGFRGAIATVSRELKTISLRDFPENLAVIEEAIKRLDVPPAAAPRGSDIEFHIHTLIAS